MPLQNRVNPYGKICFSAARGNLMGNRGCLHNDKQQVTKNYKLKNWIICVLNFKDRKRQLMSKGCYTELFFLDEATALSAGHRPCAECQRTRFKLFKSIWQEANNQANASTTEIDNFLHNERLSNENRYFRLNELPDGVFVEYNGKPYLVYGEEIFEWTFGGYMPPIKPIVNISIKLLTPFSIMKAIQQGFKPIIIREKICTSE